MKLDLYDLRARVFPALLVLLPLSLGVVAWFPDRFTGWGILSALIAGAGGYVLLSQLARDGGKRKEPHLFESWGGSPTTRRLRHRDTAFDWITLARYHQYLAQKIGIPAPTQREEAEDPTSADAVYASFSQYLREATRDRAKYPLIFAENVNYGFRRNLWGMKPAGVLISLGGAAACGLRILLSLVEGKPVPVVAIVAACLCVTMLVWWCLRISPNWVRLAAEAYADRLLGACTTLTGAGDKA